MRRILPTSGAPRLLTVYAESLGRKQRNLYGSILHLTLVDGVIVRCIHQQRQLRDDLVVRHLGGGVHSLIVLVPLQSGCRIAPS